MIPLYWVDAFSDRIFGGNPAVVCLLEEAAPKHWMQQVAAEMKQSETAFVVASGEAFQLRWFTPAAEVDLCGHATLATAHVLWAQGLLAGDVEAAFDTRSGRLTCRREGTWIVMDFPAHDWHSVAIPDGLEQVLGQTPVSTVRGTWDLAVELESQAAVRALTPDFTGLIPYAKRGVLVTAPGDGEFDFVSRFFAPSLRIDEDPVTGSTHCLLAPYWAERLGKTRLLAYQASARGGVLRLEVAGAIVKIAGQAVTVASGNLYA